MTLDQAESSGATLISAALHVDKKDRKRQSPEDYPPARVERFRSASSQSLLLTSRTVMVSEWLESVLAKPVQTARGWGPTLDPHFHLPEVELEAGKHHDQVQLFHPVPFFLSYYFNAFPIFSLLISSPGPSGGRLIPSSF